MSVDETGVSRRSIGPQAVRCGEPTQRFSALQQQLLSAAIHFFHRHIRSDADVLQRMEGNQMFRVFFEVPYHNNKPDLNRIFPDSVHDCSTLHVCSFILSILHQGIFSVSAFIVSVIYLSRFKESSHITLHACTWRPLFLTSLLLADKMWEDKPVRNSSLAKLFPVLSNAELNKMESEFLGELRFNVLVKPDLFCSFCEKLLAEQVNQEITRCVNSSEYAATLQADNGETQPLKTPQQQQQQHVSGTQLSSSQSKPQQHEHGHGSQVSVAWTEASAPNTGTSSVAPPGHGDAGAAPRSQSAGPSTKGSRRPNHGQQAGEAQPHQVHTASQSLRSVASGSSGAGTRPAKPLLTPQPPRSVSVHLHRNESQKKQTMGKVEDVSDKPMPVRPTVIQHSHHGGPPSRHSLPAKTSSSTFAPLARAPSKGAGGAPGLVSDCHGAGRSTPSGASGPLAGAPPGAGSMQGFTTMGSQGVHELSGHASISSAASTGSYGGAPGVGGRCGGGCPAGGCISGGNGGLNAGGSGLSSLRQPAQNAPRSPGVGSPVRLAAPHHQHPRQQQLLHPDRPGSQSQPAQRHAQPLSQHSASHSANRDATPPVPMAAHSTGSGGITPGHSGGAPQRAAAGMTKLQSRGVSPGAQAQGPSTSGGGATGLQQPPRAASVPRVAGAASHHNHTTPPAGSTLRTASQPMQAQGCHLGQSQGQQAPISPSIISPMVASTHTPGMPHHSGGGGSGGVTPGMGMAPGMQRSASPMGVGTPASPAGNNSLQMPHHYGGGGSGGVTPGAGMAPGMQRSASPMGVGTPATPAGNNSLQMQFGQTSMNKAQRPELLGSTRGRSPPPAVAGPSSGPPNAWAPRAVTPGALSKGTLQNMHGPGMNVTRGSLGAQMMHVHRGMG